MLLYIGGVRKCWSPKSPKNPGKVTRVVASHQQLQRMTGDRANMIYIVIGRLTVCVSDLRTTTLHDLALYQRQIKTRINQLFGLNVLIITAVVKIKPHLTSSRNY